MPKEPLKNIFSTALCEFLLQILHRSSTYLNLIRLRRGSEFSLKNSQSSSRKSVFQRFPKSVFRNFLILGLAISVAVVTRVAIVRTSASGEQQVNVYEKVKDGTYEPANSEERTAMTILDDGKRIVEIYHLRQNRIFNEKIELIVRARNQNELLGLITPPPASNSRPGQPPSRNCGERNASAFCVSQHALNEYVNLRKTMEGIKAELGKRTMVEVNTIPPRRSEGSGAQPSPSPRPQQSGAERAGLTVAGGAGALLVSPWIVAGGTIAQIGKFFKAASLFESEKSYIDRQMRIARQTLDQALAFYNEFQMAFPLHKKYREIFRQLTEYRNKAANIRREIDRYPQTFYNVTTTACL